MCPSVCERLAGTQVGVLFRLSRVAVIKRCLFSSSDFFLGPAVPLVFLPGGGGKVFKYLPFFCSFKSTEIFDLSFSFTFIFFLYY